MKCLLPSFYCLPNSQHVEYVPFGEVFIEELSSSAKLNTPFLFNGKELDEETGQYYYGA